VELYNILARISTSCRTARNIATWWSLSRHALVTMRVLC